MLRNLVTTLALVLPLTLGAAPPAATDPAGAGPFLTGAEPGLRSVRDLLDAGVYGYDAEAKVDTIGFVSDLIVGPDGRIRAVVVDVGGLGLRHVALRFETLGLDADPDWPAAVGIVSAIGADALDRALQEDPGLAIPRGLLPPTTLPPTTAVNGEAAAGNGATDDPRVWPTRTFGSEEEFPPADFAGYGIVAFNSRPDDARGRMFCEAFTAALVTVEQQVARGRPVEQQMVTVWPMETTAAARTAREAATPAEACDIAVRHYGLAVAEDAIFAARRAELAGTVGGLRGRGPFLLAWAPGEAKGAPDVLVLVANLSEVRTPEQARQDFERWKTDVALQPELWERGWSVETVRLVIQRWADGRSEALLSLIGLPR